MYLLSLIEKAGQFSHTKGHDILTKKQTNKGRGHVGYFFLDMLHVVECGFCGDFGEGWLLFLALFLGTDTIVYLLSQLDN